MEQFPPGIKYTLNPWQKRICVPLSPAHFEPLCLDNQNMAHDLEFCNPGILIEPGSCGKIFPCCAGRLEQAPD